MSGKLLSLNQATKDGNGKKADFRNRISWSRNTFCAR